MGGVQEGWQQLEEQEADTRLEGKEEGGEWRRRGRIGREGEGQHDIRSISWPMQSFGHIKS